MKKKKNMDRSDTLLYLNVFLNVTQIYALIHIVRAFKKIALTSLK